VVTVKRVDDASAMRTVAVNGTELAYEERGERGGREPVLLLHGGIVADAMAPLMAEPALAGRYRLVRYHRRGYGRSARAGGPVSVAEQAADALALLRHLGIATAHVVGYSYGGTVALQLALDAPAAVHSLALLEPLVPGVPLPPEAERYFLDAVGTAFARYAAGDPAGAIDAWAGGAFGPDYREALEAAVPRAFAQAVADADALFRVEAPTLQQWTLTPEAAARVAQATLLVSHADPTWAGFPATRERLRAWLPRSESFTLSGATHLLQMMNPRGAAEGLAAFLGRHPLTVQA
jgi:3-oxoadipate enol-lactonase